MGRRWWVNTWGISKKTLKRLESLHVETFQKNGKLQGADFFTERKVLLSQLDNGLGPLVRKGVGIPDHPKLKSAMGISSRSLVHHWKKAGVSGGIPGYATHIQGVARASQYMKVGGFVGIGLGASASALKVKETCRVGTAAECQKVKFTEGGKFTGEVVGGALGALQVSQAQGLFGVGTIGVGGLICGLVVVGATTASAGALAGNRGEKIGEKIYEVGH